MFYSVKTAGAYGNNKITMYNTVIHDVSLVNDEIDINS